MDAKWKYKALGVLSLCLALAAGVGRAAPLIIDHTCVALYTNLSASDIARVKTMWVDILGASHSGGYRVGCQLLQSNVDNRFQVNVLDSSGTPPLPYTTNYMRISRAYWDYTYNSWPYGGSDQEWYTAGTYYLERHLSFCNTNGRAISVFGLAWSWQVSWQNINSSAPDPIYNVYWSGSSVGGPDGNRAWGLNASSYAVTTNHISMDTYLQATEAYRAYCRSNGYPTMVIFTTAPVDYGGGTGYQAFLKNNYIRNYVSNTTDGVLFDYADILCWDNAGKRATNGWTDLAGNPQIYELVAADNYLDLDGSDGSGNSYHIGEVGAVRVAKALWYMLAQISKPTPPVLQVAVAQGGVQLQFRGSPNVFYAVQFSSAPLGGSWQTLTNLPAQPTFWNATVSDSPRSSGRVYRVVAE